MAIKSIRTDSAIGKICILVFALLFTFAGLIGVKWLFGNSISSRVETKEVAQLAVALAPSDPQAHFALAVMLERSFLPDDLPKSFAEYEKAVLLSPNDYRLWLSLAQARERAGDSPGAVKALERTKELAPNYSQVQWAYGNVLLREGKTEEAFKELREAVKGDSKFANPAANAAWQIFDGDIEKVKKTIGDSPPVLSALSTFLAGQKQYDEAYEIWKALPNDLKKDELRQDGERISTAFLGAKKYRKVLEIQRAISPETNSGFEVGKVSNGGFENNVRTENPSIFEWQIAQGNEPQINLAEDDKHGGSRSLVLNFKTTKKADFRVISQTVAIENGSNHTFEGYFKTDLDSPSTVKWEVVDMQSNTVIASSETFNQKTDWKKFSVDFKVPEDSEGVSIRLVRTGCEQTVCPLKGRLLIDDISIG